MNRLGRRRKRRNIAIDHSGICLKPCGVRASVVEHIILHEDEMEAIRLSDLESMYQQEAAERMGISRTTFSRLVESARKKIAEALLYHKAINIEKRI